MRDKTKKAQAAETASQGPPAADGQSRGPIVYRQGGKDVAVEAVPGMFAVRYRKGSDQQVYEALSAFGHVQAIPAQRLLIVELSDAKQEALASTQLEQWLANGLVEFVTPVLRDLESQSYQILTDEITVRFKPGTSADRLGAIEQEHQLSTVRHNEFVPEQFLMKVARSNGLRTLNVASQLDDADDVVFATPNFISEYRR